MVKHVLNNLNRAVHRLSNIILFIQRYLPSVVEEQALEEDLNRQEIKLGADKVMKFCLHVVATEQDNQEAQKVVWMRLKLFLPHNEHCRVKTNKCGSEDQRIPQVHDPTVFPAVREFENEVV